MPKKTIAQVRAIFQQVADEQPVPNDVMTWSLEGVHVLPAYVMERLAELFAE